MSTTETPFVRTADENLGDLVEFPYEPHYLDVSGPSTPAQTFSEHRVP